MKYSSIAVRSLSVLFALALHVGVCGYAVAQARPTATETARLSVFGGATGTFTGLNSSKNGGVTAGVDLGFRPFFKLRPSIEVRGTYPFYNGQVDSQKNVLAGLKVEGRYGRFRPYGDILFGRGSIDYSFPYPDPTRSVAYLRTVSNVLAGGGGVDYDVSPRFALKADAQYQRYGVPVTASGKLYATALTAGIVYRIDLNHHARHVRYR